MTRDRTAEMGAPDEQSSLLPQNVQTETPVDNVRKDRIVPLCYWIYFFVFIFLLEAGDAVFDAPKVQLYEQVICRKYYEGGVQELSVSNGAAQQFDCKIEPVQTKLAHIIGIQDALSALPAILIGLPAGYLADKIGRRIVMSLAVFGYLLSIVWTGIVCAFPNTLNINLVWLCPAFSILAGGASTASSLVFATAGDLVSEKNRVNMYIAITATVLVSSMLAKFVTSALLTIDVWIPIVANIGLAAVSVMMACFWPKTSNEVASTSSIQDILRHSSNESSELTSEDFNGPSLWQVMRNRILYCAKHLEHYKEVYALFTVALLTFTTRWVTAPFLQYASRRFHISYSKANVLEAIYSASTLVTMLGIFPLASHLLLTRAKFDVFRKDMLLLKISTASYAVGAFMLGVSRNFASSVPGIIVLGGGTVSAAFLRSMVLSLISKQHYNIAQTAISVLLVCGQAIAGPLYSALLSESFHLYGFWTGIPLFTAALFSALALLILIILRPTV